MAKPKMTIYAKPTSGGGKSLQLGAIWPSAIPGKYNLSFNMTTEDGQYPTIGLRDFAKKFLAQLEKDGTKAFWIDCVDYTELQSTKGGEESSSGDEDF